MVLRERIHGLSGELEARYGELEERYQEEKRLRAELEEHAEHLRRTYAELERLTELIQTMEGTRAWRAHEFVQRWKR